nr:DNA-binding protein HEXBP [Tanacetum cinerariifolium]
MYFVTPSPAAKNIILRDVGDGCCKLCGGVTHLAKDCPNKGNRSSGMSNEFRKRWKNTFIIYEANYSQKCGDDEKSDNARTQQSTIEMHDDDEKSLLNQILSLRPTQQERVRLLVGSPGASTTPVYSPGSSSTSIYSPGSLTPPRYSPGASTPQSYSMGTSRNAKCSNCKHLLDKITVLEATVDMYMHLEQHTVNSAALFYEVYSNMGKLDLE